MRKIAEEVSLIGRCEEISISEFRKAPGDVLKAVELGKVFVIKRNGKSIAVLSALPGQCLTINVESDGEKSYRL